MTFRHSKQEHWRRWVEENVGDYALNVSKGLVEGTTGINKFGANLDITKNTSEDVWDGGGTYPFPTTALMTKLVQATNQVGTDANATIEIQGLDANWDLVIQTADLDGSNTTTEVSLTTPLIRCFRMKVLEDIVLAADVSVVATGGGTTYATIHAGNNQTLMAIYTVPAGKTAYLTNYYASQTDATNKTPTSTGITLWMADRANGYEFQVKHAIGIPQAGNMAQHQFVPYGAIPEKTDIKITASPADEDANIAAGFDLYVVDD